MIYRMAKGDNHKRWVLWISKERPPQYAGVYADAQASGGAALARWRKYDYALIILDGGPLADGQTGVDMARTFHTLANRTPIVFMAPRTTPANIAMGRKLGMTAVITKDPAQVKRALEKYDAVNWSDRVLNKHPGRQSISIDTPVGTWTQRVRAFFGQAQDDPLEPTTVIEPPLKHHVTQPIEQAATLIEKASVSTQETPMSTEPLALNADGLPVLRFGPQASSIRAISNPHGLDLTIFHKLGEDYREADRQFAWEVYTELATRTAVTGRYDDPTCTKVEGELLMDSFASLLAFCKELRFILREFPATAAHNNNPHLGGLLVTITRQVLNPFLDKWRQMYLDWWDHSSDKDKIPLDRQQEFPRLHDMLVEWRELKMTMRAVQDSILKSYKLQS